MGTNYYWEENPCPSCGRADRLHLCKSLRNFQGHFRWDDEHCEHRPWLTSWADWKAWLRSAAKPGRVVDEYGVVHDTEEFIAWVEAIPAADRRRHFDYCREHYGPGDVRHTAVGVAPYHDWLDGDGFSFYGGDFS